MRVTIYNYESIVLVLSLLDFIKDPLEMTSTAFQIKLQLCENNTWAKYYVHW